MSSFFTYHPLSLLYCPCSTPSTFFTYHPLSRPTILFLCCSVLILQHTIFFLHCTACCLHSTILFWCRQISKRLQKIFSNSTSLLLIALQSVFALALSLFHWSCCIELAWWIEAFKPH
jgi:hypothetical protein